MTRSSPTFPKSFPCQCCGAQTMRTGPTQKYCAPCSAEKNRERQARYYRKAGRTNPDPARSRRNREARQGRLIAAGEALTDASSILGRGAPELAWEVRIAVPFEWAFSKNNVYANRGQGHVALRAETRAARTSLAYELKNALNRDRHRVKQNRLWISIFVQKPNHRGDAINVLDVVADAIKDAVPLDDRWYSIRHLDWEIVKVKPRIFIGVGQEDVEDVRACSYCGRLLTLDMFVRDRRECADCVRASSQHSAGGGA